MWSDVLFTSVLMLIVYSVVHSLYVTHRTFVLVDKKYKSLDKEHGQHIKNVLELKQVGKYELDRLGKNLDQMQEKCLQDATKYCLKCKDCPYKRGG